MGILCCSYAVMQYRKIYNHESIYLLALFFAGTYLIVRSSMALILNNIRNRQERKYYRHLLQRNKLYYRSKTAARYGVLFFVLSFLVCFYFGFQVISVATAEPVSSLYPYDFMCIADDKDEKLLRNLEKTYQSDISITEYPKEEAHKYIGNYDFTVRFHYDSETAKADMTSERTVKILINSYLMLMLAIIDMIIFYTMCQMELREITLRERFLKNLGMNEKERRKIYRKEISFYYYLPADMLVVALGLFLRAVLKARMFPETIAQMCIRLEVLLTVGVLFLRMLYAVIIYQVFSRKAGMRDER